MLMARATCPFSRYRLPSSRWISSASRTALGGLAQLLDGEIDLIGDEEVQAEDVVQRLAGRAGDRSTGRRAACSVPTPCRRRARREARSARRGTGSRRSRQLCPPQVVQVKHAFDAGASAPTDDQRGDLALLHDEAAPRAASV